MRKVVQSACIVSAFIGGVVMLGLIFMVSVSIVGRSLVSWGLSAIPGDFELMEIGMAFVIFCFLPLCEFKKKHIGVDILKDLFPVRVNRFLDSLIHFLMFGVSSFILWRLWPGMADKFLYEESSFILQIPSGWSYAIVLPPAILWAITALYVFIDSLRPAQSFQPYK